MIVVFGSINLDFICAVDALPAPGQTLISSGARIEPGGKGANQAVAAARDGARVTFAGAVGRDSLAEQALSGLVASGIDLARTIRTEIATGLALITVDAAGCNHVVVAAGANLAARASQVEDAVLEPGTVLLLQMENDPAETASLIHRARSRGARVVLSLAPAGELPIEALRAVDTLLVNEDEAVWLGGHLGTGGTAVALARTLGVRVIRTLGGEGLEAADRHAVHRLPAHQVAVVDTTAAGDCFAGVFAAGLDRGLDWHAAARRAIVAAALCCTRAGTQGSLPSRPETDRAIATLEKPSFG